MVFFYFVFLTSRNHLSRSYGGRSLSSLTGATEKTSTVNDSGIPKPLINGTLKPHTRERARTISYPFRLSTSHGLTMIPLCNVYVFLYLGHWTFFPSLRFLWQPYLGWLSSRCILEMWREGSDHSMGGLPWWYVSPLGGLKIGWTNNEETWYISRSITAGDETVTMWYFYDAWPPAGETCDGSGVSCRARNCAFPVRIEAVASNPPNGTRSVEGCSDVHV